MKLKEGGEGIDYVLYLLQYTLDRLDRLIEKEVAR